MATIVVTPGSDGNILVELRRALQELELRGIAAQGLAQASLEHGLIRVADDVESEALAILNGVHIGGPNAALLRGGTPEGWRNISSIRELAGGEASEVSEAGRVEDNNPFASILGNNSMRPRR